MFNAAFSTVLWIANILIWGALALLLFLHNPPVGLVAVGVAVFTLYMSDRKDEK